MEDGVESRRREGLATVTGRLVSFTQLHVKAESWRDLSGVAGIGPLSLIRIRKAEQREERQIEGGEIDEEEEEEDLWVTLFVDCSSDLLPFSKRFSLLEIASPSRFHACQI